MTKRLFTSESVTEGHPDKMADQISDAILDDLLRQDPGSRVAVESLLRCVRRVLLTSLKLCAGLSWISGTTPRSKDLTVTLAGCRSLSASSRPTSPRVSTTPWKNGSNTALIRWTPKVRAIKV